MYRRPTAGSPGGSTTPSDRDLKRGLAREISRIASTRGLTQIETAELLETTQPKVSALFAGRIEGFSVGRLMRYLNALDQDVHLVVLPKVEPGPPAGVRLSVGDALIGPVPLVPVEETKGFLRGIDTDVPAEDDRL